MATHGAMLALVLALALSFAHADDGCCTLYEAKLASLEQRFLVLEKQYELLVLHRSGDTTEQQQAKPPRQQPKSNESIEVSNLGTTSYGRRLSSTSSSYLTTGSANYFMHEFPEGHSCPNYGSADTYRALLPATNDAGGISWKPSGEYTSPNVSLVSVSKGWSTSVIDAMPVPLKIVHDASCSSTPTLHLTLDAHFDIAPSSIFINGVDFRSYANYGQLRNRGETSGVRGTGSSGKCAEVYNGNNIQMGGCNAAQDEKKFMWYGQMLCSSKPGNGNPSCWEAQSSNGDIRASGNTNNGDACDGGSSDDCARHGPSMYWYMEGDYIQGWLIKCKADGSSGSYNCAGKCAQAGDPDDDGDSAVTLQDCVASGDAKAKHQRWFWWYSGDPRTWPL